MDSKKCTKCELAKNLADFYKHPQAKDGLRTWCKNCCHKWTKQWRSENRERDNANHRTRRAKLFRENPRLCKARDMLNSSRRNARKKGMDHAITLEHFDWQAQDYCAAFPWIKLSWDNLNWWKDNSPSLDRVDNTVGYIPGNVRIVSLRANKKKGDATQQEIIALYEYITIRDQGR